MNTLSVRSILAFIIIATGAVLAVAVRGDGPALPAQNDSTSTLPESAVDTATHETWSEPQETLRFSNANQISPRIEPFSPPPPTRRSFMATWVRITGATSYRLDVSTNYSFSSYVDGYRDLDVGNVTGSVVTNLNPATTYYYRIRAYNANGSSAYSQVMSITTIATTGLSINPTFDSSITTNPNAAAIEATINRAISIYESLFSDPITIEILFRYATTAPDDTPLPAGFLSGSIYVVYPVPWNVYTHALSVDAKTGNDVLAIASLPVTALSANVKLSSAGGRAVGLNTPPIPYPVLGGPYDGIVTLNSAAPFQLTRPTSASNFDAQRVTEHEIDEVMGLGSYLGQGASDLRPQDLFGWSSPAIRNLTLSGPRYFSVDGGVTDIANFNQGPAGDFGDWSSEACPQLHPYVQDAFGCTGQSSDVTATSPEGIALDVIGYDLVGAPPAGAGALVTVPEASVGAGSANDPTINYAQSARSTLTPTEMPQSTHLQTTYGSSGLVSQILKLGSATNAAQILGHWKDGLYVVDAVWVQGAFKACGTEEFPCILIPHPAIHLTPTPSVLAMDKKTNQP
jgi:hypothetical protein